MGGVGRAGAVGAVSPVAGAGGVSVPAAGAADAGGPSFHVPEARGPSPSNTEAAAGRGGFVSLHASPPPGREAPKCLGGDVGRAGAVGAVTPVAGAIGVSVPAAGAADAGAPGFHVPEARGPSPSNAEAAAGRGGFVSLHASPPPGREAPECLGGGVGRAGAVGAVTPVAGATGASVLRGGWLGTRDYGHPLGVVMTFGQTGRGSARRRVGHVSLRSPPRRRNDLRPKWPRCCAAAGWARVTTVAP